MTNNIRNSRVAALSCLCYISFSLASQSVAADDTPHPKQSPATISVNWDAKVGSATELTIQVCPEPPMRRGGAIHRQAHDALRDLNMRYARLQPWFPFPRLSMAALEPPTTKRTSWDFSLIDPIVLDFYQAAEGRPIILNMAIPGWLFKGRIPSYPKDPNEIDWNYEYGPEVGKEPRDPTFGEIADYFKRVAEWYIKGSFTDELGREHRSGHRLKIDYWEVLNEQDEGMGHDLSPEAYTALYDEVVSRLQPIDPDMKFSGLALSVGENLHYIEYFLNPRNHKVGIPLDMISYHKYVFANTGRTLAEWQREMYMDADRFIRTAQIIEGVKNRLSPRTKTFVSEFGFMYGPEFSNTLGPLNGKPVNYNDPYIPNEYWQLAASVFAHVFVGASHAGLDLMAAAELINYPGQFAGTNLIHWRTGEPNAVYATVKMIHENIPAESTMVETKSDNGEVTAQAFYGPSGRKLLIANRSIISTSVTVKAATDATVHTVDNSRGTILKKSASSETIELSPNAVTIVSWPPM